jgi:hypothetical protein
MAIMRSATVLLALVGHLGAEASEYDWSQQSRRDFFYVGGEYTNLTVSPVISVCIVIASNMAEAIRMITFALARSSEEHVVDNHKSRRSETRLHST